MRKREIEAVSYITVSNTSREKGVRYLAVTAQRIFGNKRHIILEVYRNEKKCLQVPLVRYVANQNEWAVFYPATGTWTRERIGAGSRKVWQKEGLRQGMRAMDILLDVVLQSRQDTDRIRHFFRTIKVWNDDRWWEYFEKHEDVIIYDAERKKTEAKRTRLEERIKATPVLREQEILKWASKKMAMAGHCLYYKIRGSRANVCCSACGDVTDVRWKIGESYESDMFEPHIQRPYEGNTGYCRLCGAFGTYKPLGKAKQETEQKMHVFTADKYGDDGVVLRYVDVYKSCGLNTIRDAGGNPEMIGAYENMQCFEIARTYFVPGQKSQTDYCKYNPCTNREYWDDCNLYGMSNISILKGAVHPDTWEALKDTFLQYCAMEEYAKEYGVINARDYLERYKEWPQMEMLVKMKLYSVVTSMVSGHCGIIADPCARRPEAFLGIRKDKVKLLIETRGNLGVLDILQIERRWEQCWTSGQVMALAEIEADVHKLDRALAVMTVQKLLNNICGYAGCEYGTGCLHATERLRHMATTYFDYLDMRAQLGYDLHNTVYQKPRNIEAEHDRMLREADEKEQGKRTLEVEEKYPEIRKRYRKLKKQYFYEDNTYLIRPARSAGEIVKEGRCLHHCVGKDSYLKSHNEGESIILMLRYRAEPGIPYITVEIMDERIIQWYGAHDRKPDKENMQRWLDAYTEMLKSRRYGTSVQPEQEAVQLLQALA